VTRTAIVCTIGPASERDQVLRGMLEAGMAYARLNFSHGTADHHRQCAEAIRRVATELSLPLQIIQDLQGPKIRTVKAPPTRLRVADEVVLSGEAAPGALQISEPAALDAVAPGDRVYIDDGAIELEIVERTREGLRCRVIIGGVLAGNQGVVFPSAKLALPALTEKDLADASIGREIGVDWVALSFVRVSDDVEALRSHISQGTRVIAKIETPAALENIASIISASDAVMIARGDLGVAIPRARVPIVQKDIIKACRQQGTESIVATEMLLSMVRRRYPTRAEVADVATAVLDGCNAVMLSEETAIGAYPVEAVSEMHNIIETIEASGYWVWGEE